jgi:hypothetical protein
MKNYPVILFLTLCSAFVFPACDLNQPPEAVWQSFAQKYPGVESVQWSLDENGYYEGHFRWQGEKLRADFGQEGNWRETESSVSFEELPGAVKAVIEKEFSKKDIEEIEKTDSHERGIFYDVEFKPKGAEKFDVEFAADGTVLAKKRR